MMLTFVGAVAATAEDENDREACDAAALAKFDMLRVGRAV